MPQKLTIQRAGQTDRVRLTPFPLELAVAQHRDPDGRLRVEVVGDPSLAELPQAADGVRCSLTPAHSALFEPLAADTNPGAGITFTVRAGQSVTLTLKPPANLPARSTRPPGAARFVKDAAGHPQPQFTWVADLQLNRPRASGGGHNDLHVEC